MPYAKPEELGFSAQRLAAIDEFHAEKVRTGEMAGVVTLVARRGRIAHFSAVGYADVERRKKMRTDAIFRLYSMTKPIAATALMMLYEEGRFQLRDPISMYLPEFANLRVLRTPDSTLDDTVPLERPPTVQDVLRHTAGFSHGLGASLLDAEYVKANVFGLDVSLEEMMGRLARLPLRNQPGTAFAYSVGPDIQGRLVEVLSGMPFDRFLETRLFGPLGMKDSGFWLAAEQADRLATVHWSKAGKLTPLDAAHGYPGEARKDGRGLVLYQPWSVNSYLVDHERKGGSFGVAATAADYWRFAQALQNGGELEGVRILGPRTVQYMVRDHLGSIPAQDLDGSGWGLGFAVLKDPALAGEIASEGSYSHGGAATTYCWVDPKEQLVVVVMTQHMGVEALESLSGQIQALVYGALIR